MSSLPTSASSRGRPPSAGQRNHPVLPTLMESLSGSFAAARPPTHRKRSMSESMATTPTVSYVNDAQTERLGAHPWSFRDNALGSSRATSIAFTALRYLPTPILILSSFKTVVLANEAMGKLLNSGAENGREANAYSGNVQSAVEDKFHGLSLSDLGVSMVLNDDQAWAGWDVCTESPKWLAPSSC